MLVPIIEKIFFPLVLFTSFICLTLLLILFSQKSTVGGRCTAHTRTEGVPFDKGLSSCLGRIGV